MSEAGDNETAQQRILVRYDEIALKGRNRGMFERSLKRNMAASLGLPRSAVRMHQGRLFVQPEPNTDTMALSRVFGLRSFSHATCVVADPNLEAIGEAAVAAAKEAHERGASTFKIEARRADKTFPLESYPIAARVGEIVLEAVSGLRVDVHDPDCVVGVEIRSGATGIVFNSVIPGPGGLPVGTTGRALVLLSGGLDSPVAAWLAMKRGLAVDAIYFHAFPYTGEKTQEKVLELARLLVPWRGGPPITVMVPAFAAVQDAIAEAVEESLWTVALRYLMYMTADRLALERGYGALVTGDSLGQVASQTLENLVCLEQARETLLLRPLIGFDKYEIIDLARRIGTEKTSILPYDDCCTLFAPRRPATRAKAVDVRSACARLDLDGLVTKAIDAGERFEVAADGVCDSGPLRRTASAS